MTVVRLRGLRDAIPTPEETPLTATIQRWSGHAPVTVFDGADVTLPAPVVVDVNDETITLPPTDGRYCIRWTLTTSLPGVAPVIRYTSIPATASVDFAALPDVDPYTFGPGPDVVTAWEHVLADVRVQTAAALEHSTDAGTAAFNAGRSAAIALGHANDADHARDEALEARTDAGAAADDAEAARDQAVAAAAIVAPLDVSRSLVGTRVDTRGPSWVAFGSYGSAPFPDLIAAALGADGVDNHGHEARRAQDTAWIMANSAHPDAWNVDRRGIAIVQEPCNNLMDPDTPGNRNAAEESVRAIVAMASASARVEQTGWVYRGAWSEENPQPYASGGTVRVAFFAGLEVDIPVPAGTSYLLCHGTDVAVARGATVHVSQNGKLIASKSLDGKTIVTPYEASNGVSPVAIRLPNLAAGIVTVTIDHAGLTGQVIAIIDALLPQSPNPRPILLVKPVQLLAPSHEKPALLAHCRSVVDVIRAEFGEHVVAVDAAPGWNPALGLGADLLHPTPEGTAHHRDAAVAAFRAWLWQRLTRLSLSQIPQMKENA